MPPPLSAFLLQLLPHIHNGLAQPVLAPALPIRLCLRRTESDAPDAISGTRLDVVSSLAAKMSPVSSLLTSTSSLSPVSSNALDIITLSLHFVNLW